MRIVNADNVMLTLILQMMISSAAAAAKVLIDLSDLGNNRIVTNKARSYTWVGLFLFVARLQPCKWWLSP
jgi:hypothetical protein